MQNEKKRAIFFDRDGTLSVEAGYINHVDRFDLMPFACETIKLVNESEFIPVLITNQSGLARDYFTEEVLNQVHEKLAKLLAKKGAYLEGIYYCPHHEFGEIKKYRKICECRKPAPGMLNQAAKDLNIDLKKSYMIGDKYTDIELAHNVGATGIMVMTGYGLGEHTYQQHKWTVMPHYTTEDALEAVKLIFELEKKQKK